MGFVVYLSKLTSYRINESSELRDIFWNDDCKRITRHEAKRPDVQTSRIEMGLRMKLENIKNSQSMVNFIRAHTVELYTGYKIFAGIFDRETDANLLLKLIAEIETDFTSN